MGKSWKRLVHRQRIGIGTAKPATKEPTSISAEEKPEPAVEEKVVILEPAPVIEEKSAEVKPKKITKKPRRSYKSSKKGK